MKTYFLLLCTLISLHAEPSARELSLRDAIFTEEINRDPAKAAPMYENIIADYENERKLMLTALFHLAEIRKAEGKKESAIALYQKIVRDFSDQGKITSRSQAALTELGATPIVAKENATPQKPTEDTVIAEFEKVFTSSPDLASPDEIMDQALYFNSLKLLQYIKQKHPNYELKILATKKEGDRILARFADDGNLPAIKYL